MKIAKLKNWSLYKSNSGKYHLTGNVYRHDNFNDGDLIDTSRVFLVDENNEYEYYINTTNTKYICDPDDFNLNGEIGTDETIVILNKLTKFRTR